MITDDDHRAIQELVRLLQGRPIELVAPGRPAQNPAGQAESSASQPLAVQPQGDQETASQDADGLGTRKLKVNAGGQPDSSQRLPRWRRLFRKPPVVGAGFAVAAGTFGPATIMSGGPREVLLGVGGAVLAAVCTRVMDRSSSPGSEAP